jgi:hypothetical protein
LVSATDWGKALASGLEKVRVSASVLETATNSLLASAMN